MTSTNSRFLATGILIGIAAFAGCNRTDPVDSGGDTSDGFELQMLGVLPEFEFSDQVGQSYGSRQLFGKVWIANFMFTRCAATCPIQTAQLARLQKKLQSTPSWEEVRLVSITVDPEHDTPELLHEYAEGTGADPDHWKFLTGQRDAIWQLSKDGFKLPVGESDDTLMPIAHSAKFVLIDPYLRIRGFYEATLDDDLTKLNRDLKHVLGERVAIPEEAINPPWLEKRRQDQLKTVDNFDVLHDFQFTDMIEESGIRFRNKIVDDAGRSWVACHYDHGNGVAIADVDGDGNLDIYFVTQAGRNELWKNLGDGRFEDITDRAGVAMENTIGVTATFADIDNDGDPDLYTTSVRGGNAMFENTGDGSFKDISTESGLNHTGHSSGAVFFDYDRDGLLDVFLTNVGKYTSEEIATVTMEQVRGEPEADYKFYSGYVDAFGGHMPGKNRNERSLLFKNLGDNRFEDVSENVGLLDESWSGDASPVDFNEDGWPDLYVTNMQGNDEYYVNVEGKHFEKKSRDVFPLTPWGAMGIKAFDFDNDADIDLFITDMHSDMSEDVGPEREKLKSNVHRPDSPFTEDFLQTKGQSIFGNAFYRNDGKGNFEEVSDQIGAENYWPWGLSVGDLNADGFQDAFVTSSMNYPFRYGVNSLLLNNLGKEFLDSEFILGVEPRRDGRVAEPWFELDEEDLTPNSLLAKELATKRRGSVMWSALGTRSSVIFDLDNDGDLDIVTNEHNSRPMVLISNLSEKHQNLNYVKIKLVGAKSNRDALGAVVKVRAGSRTYLKVHDGQSGYLSQSLCPLYFGLGEASTVDEIEVIWPTGESQTIPGPLESNRTLEVNEQ